MDEEMKKVVENLEQILGYLEHISNEVLDNYEKQNENFDKDTFITSIGNAIDQINEAMYSV